MPLCHLALWRHLDGILNNELVVAGSFAGVQMRHNLSGDETEYNDIDYWYDETEGAVLSERRLERFICKCMGTQRSCLHCTSC